MWDYEAWQAEQRLTSIQAALTFIRGVEGGSGCCWEWSLEPGGTDKRGDVHALAGVKERLVRERENRRGRRERKLLMGLR